MLSFLHKKIISLWNIVKLKKQLGVFGIVFLFTALIAGWFLTTNQASADITSSVRDLSLALSDLTLWIAGLLLKLTIFVLKFIIELGGYNGYLDSPAVTVGWVMVRDVVNMGFVIILLIIAFGTILGLEQYEWKKMIVKFLLAAVLVNFSRTICGLIIDAAQVVMTTFINGVAATAGGNLINAFHADKIMSLSNGVKTGELDAQAVYMAATAALVFTVMMLVTMVIYLVILLFRMISLWVLIVLSPIAFVASVIPQTQKYASEWWKEFANNVISGPLLIFFLWLSFVTIGSGQIHSQINDPNNNSVPASALITGDNSAALADLGAVGQGKTLNTDPTTDKTVDQKQTTAPSSGISSVMTWDSMANFFIALAMLLVGAKKAQELGVMGSSMLGKVSDIGKKAFMMASGVGAGLWAAKHVALPAGKFVAMNVPLVGGKSWIRRGQKIGAAATAGWAVASRYRDMGAKKLEEESKARAKIEQDIKDKKDKGEFANEGEIDRYRDEERQKAGIRGGVGGAAIRGLKGLLVAGVESGGRADKRAENWVEAAKYEQQITEGEYSTSGSTVGGRWKTKARAVAEVTDKKSKAKGKGHVDARVKTLYEIDKNKLDKANAQVAEGTKEKEEADKALAVAQSGGDAGQIAAAQEARSQAQDKIDAGKTEAKKLAVSLTIATTAAEAKGEVVAAQRKEQEEGEKAAFGATDAGIGFTQALNLAEQGTKGAQEFIKTLKNQGLKKIFVDVGKAMADIVNNSALTNAEKIQGINALADQDTQTGRFVRSLKLEQEGVKAQEELTYRKGEVDNAAAGWFLEMPTSGTISPSTATASATKRVTEGWATMGPDAMADAGTRQLAHIMKKNMKGEKIEDYEHLVSLGAMGKINAEGFADNLVADLANKLTRFETKERTPGAVISNEEREDYQALRLLAEKSGAAEKIGDEWHGMNGADDPNNVSIAGSLNQLRSEGVEAKTGKDRDAFEELRDEALSTGKIVEGGDGVFSAKTSRASIKYLQTFAATAGDQQFAAQDKEISDEVDGSGGKKTYAEVLKTKTYGGAFLKKLQEYNTYLKDAADSFTKSGLAIGHAQLVGHFKFDAQTGLHRPATPQEALDRVKSEARKADKSLHSSIQYQGLGVVDTKKDILLSNCQAMVDAFCTKLTDGVEAGRVKIRTLAAIFHSPLQDRGVVRKITNKEGKVGSFGLVGGGAAEIQKDYGSQERYFQDKLFPWLSNMKQLTMMGAAYYKHGVNKVDSEKGKAMLAIEIFDKNGKAKELSGVKSSQFLKEIIDSQEDFGMTNKQKKILEDVIGMMEGLEEGLNPKSLRLNNEDENNNDDDSRRERE